MKKQIRVYLEDITSSSEKIAAYVEGKTIKEFGTDEKLQDAVIRRLEIIGEAVKRLPLDFREKHPDISWKSAAGMRDVLIHAYDEVETEPVWKTITEDLPKFSRQIKALLRNFDE